MADASADTAATCPLFLAPVNAGWPSAAEDYIDGQVNLHELIVRHPAATFFLRAAGDSMLGVGIHDGDLLVVDRSLEASHNRVVIAALDGELLVKKLCRKDGRVLLQPANPDYPEFDITEREYAHIWGVVSHVVHRL
nr:MULTISPECIES: translesion error-prone DNA polymerase V autoproteolytic subunit [unclassified Desulfovibrio]